MAGGPDGKPQAGAEPLRGGRAEGGGAGVVASPVNAEFDSPVTGPLKGGAVLLLGIIFVAGSLLLGDDDKPGPSDKNGGSPSS